MIDFWKAEGEGPRPLLVFIHGGGWTGGDKGNDTVRFVRTSTRESLAPPSITDSRANIRTPHRCMMPPGQFSSSGPASEWNIDTQHIALTGGSAGACTSMWLLLHDDLADPKAEDPVARQSTRVCAAAVSAGQTSISTPRSSNPGWDRMS